MNSGRKVMIIRLTFATILPLQLDGNEAIPFILSATVCSPFICCNLERIDLMPHSTRTSSTNIDCCKATLIDAELASRTLNETAAKQVNA